MNRRIFTKNLGACAVFLGLGAPSFAQKKAKTKHITILHTNDTHSHIDPLPTDDPKNPNQGGVARRAVLVQQIRQENPNTLLLDAGDIFQGTPYFNYYGGELEYKLMSKLGYDAATLGNHDFDNGLEGILAPLPHAKFHFISSNYDFSNTLLHGYTQPYRVFVKDGIRIGVYGLGIDFEGLVDKKLYKETRYLNPVEVMTDMERILKKDKKCDLIICLSHLGYKYKTDKISDVLLAEKTQETDLIIGGHTHTFLQKPTLITNQKGKQVIVNQVGCYGINLGRIDFYFGKENTSDSALIQV